MEQFAPAQHCAIKLTVKNDAEVSEQFMLRVWAGGREIKGLVQRRAAEYDLYGKKSCDIQKNDRKMI